MLLEGTAIDFVVDALLGAPSEAADAEVRCSGFKPARNASLAPGPAQKKDLSPLTRPRMGSADQPEPVNGHMEGYEEDLPGNHGEGPSYSGPSNSKHFRDLFQKLEGTNSGGRYGGYGKYDPNPPSPPEEPLDYTSDTLFEVYLKPLDINATGHLTQDDFDKWGKDRMFGPKHFLLLRPGFADPGRRQVLKPI